MKIPLKPLFQFFLRGRLFRFFLLCLLGAFAIWSYRDAGQARRTFLFYSSDEGGTIIEERMIPRTGTQEGDIARYIEEALLGPATSDTALLFPKETRLQSLLFRGGTAYVDFTEDAAFPVLEGADIFQNFSALNAGIRRNFKFVINVRFYIMGNVSFFDRFNLIYPEKDPIADKTA